MLRVPRKLRWQRITLALGLAPLLGCGSPPPPSGGYAGSPSAPAGRIEQRSLSDRPPLAIIERDGDPEAALGFASLAAESAELHAELGKLLSERLARAGFHTQLVAHGLGFELTVLAAPPDGAGAATTALLQALTRPVAAAELTPRSPGPELERAAPSAIAQCSAELSGRGRAASAAELERERVATFARDRAALSIVGSEQSAAAVADALGDGPDWPELGPVRSILPERSATQVLRGERATLSVAFTLGDANRALGAAERLGDAQGALAARLAALGAGLKLRRVGATAHPLGACLRIDSEVDASPPPDARRLGFAVDAIDAEAQLALAETPDAGRLETSALSAGDPRRAARAAAYAALLAEPRERPRQRLIALTTLDGGPQPPAIEAAVEQARGAAAPLDTQVRVERGQPGLWALLATPCAAVEENADTAGHAALLMSAASELRVPGVKLEPCTGDAGVGLFAYAERTQAESEQATAARVADALGRALVSAASALDVAAARGELLKSAGAEPRPLLLALLEALTPGHVGALSPRGTPSSLQMATREAVLTRQRELLRLPHRLAVLAPGSADDARVLSARLGRWLKGPEAPRSSPCTTVLSPPARGELTLAAGTSSNEGSYLAFRISPQLAPEAALLVELLNLPGGALERSMAEPELVGAARATLFGTSSARALVIQVSGFEGREAEASSRVQQLFERLAAGGVLTSADLESAVKRRRAQHRVAALDPRYRLVELLEQPAPGPGDAAALKRLVASLRPEAAIVARPSLRASGQTSGKSAPSR
ncbi:MAG TPA: hypothetical protein VIW29_04325 [Polyangiaceae bacterium]